MEYLSFVSSLSKQDLKDLAKQMKICCSGNKTELCDRIMTIVDKFEQTGGFDCTVGLPRTPEETIAIFEQIIKDGGEVDGRGIGDFRTSTGYSDHTVYLEACENMIDFKDPKDLVSKFLKKHDTNPGQDPRSLVMTYRSR